MHEIKLYGEQNNVSDVLCQHVTFTCFHNAVQSSPVHRFFTLVIPPPFLEGSVSPWKVFCRVRQGFLSARRMSNETVRGGGMVHLKSFQKSCKVHVSYIK